ncbi:hypothetical protein D6D94_01120 [Moraxella catarrhalis]|uniref:tRNA_anti-like family protein n=1 Tax=Moraxella catarrhalis TaxID=480 RepID=A0A3A9KRK6_MORCA|nr:hypothetical protein [Moraxella catarrhalis]ADG61221.1 hypothetical protein MCR_0956 [Moraxella catarrhalis BBH18]ARE65466.1 hypothetical protein MC195_01330 [Moraxella catarrhalis]AXT94924.1 hypothetical protein SQ00_04350 [Moraxella catarrhalis]AXT96540.1 hypothetical protein SQ01_04495 [Moraxella catarrhalis]AZQ93908.1 tRNA_anti-like family protein [Moraxella catarrhalis]
MKKLFKFILIAVIALIGLGIIIGMLSGGDNNNQSASNNTAEPAAPAEPPMMVSATEIASDYDDNEVAADQKYKGKMLEVSGNVARIDSGVGDKAIVQLVGKNEFQTVSAQGNNDFTQYATTLKKGQDIVLVCKGDGEVIGSPQLKNCQPK